jgi:hypothetical protein
MRISKKNKSTTDYCLESHALCSNAKSIGPVLLLNISA